MPKRKPKRQRGWPSTSDASKLDVLLVPQMRRLLSLTMKASARGGEAAGHSPGAIMPSAIGWRPASNRKNGRAGDALRRRSGFRKRAPIAWELRARLWSGPRTSRGGMSYPHLDKMSRCAPHPLERGFQVSIEEAGELLVLDV
jgi:hypothetical protein